MQRELMHAYIRNFQEVKMDLLSGEEYPSESKIPIAEQDQLPDIAGVFAAIEDVRIEGGTLRDAMEAWYAQFD